MDFALEIRATEDMRERERYEAEGSDVCVLVFIAAEAVAWCDDYGTAHLIAGTAATPGKDEVEAFVRAAGDFWETVA